MVSDPNLLPQFTDHATMEKFPGQMGHRGEQYQDGDNKPLARYTLSRRFHFPVSNSTMQLEGRTSATWTQVGRRYCC